MVRDGLNWVRVFGCGLEMGKSSCTWQEWLNIKGSEWEWAENEWEWIKNEWKWVGVGGRGWEWMGVSGSSWEQMGVDKCRRK